MTLIDTRRGILQALNALNAEFDVRLDGEHFVANLGPPLHDALRGYGIESPLLDALVTRFRALYPDVVIDLAELMPGAADALAAVRAAGGRTLVVTGKHEPAAALHLKALGWEVDHLRGGVFASRKGDVLHQQGASIYVGDHWADVVGAKTGGAVAVGVATGPFRVAELVEAGADVVLADLTEFRSWFDGSPRSRR